MDLSHPSFHGHYNELSFSHHRPQIDVSSSSPPSRVPHNKHRRNLSSSTPKKQQIVAQYVKEFEFGTLLDMFRCARKLYEHIYLVAMEHMS